MGRAGRTGTAGRKKSRPTAPASATSLATAGGGVWADLPDVLLLLVLDRLPSVADISAVAGVCRSWRAIAGPPAFSIIAGGRPPLLLSPLCCFPDTAADSVYYNRDRLWIYPRRCGLLSAADPAASYHCFLRPSILALPFLGYSHGHLIFCRCRSHSRPLLADVARGDVLEAPALPYRLKLDHGVLTAPLSAPDCSLLLWRAGSKLFRWRVGEREWSEHSFGVDTHGITVLRGQILALDRHATLFAIEFSPSFSIRRLEVQWMGGGSRPQLFPYPGRVWRCGEELMLLAMPRSRAQVYRLDLSAHPSWVEVESLGDAALFIDEHGCFLCPNPSRWGGRSNCLYLAPRRHDTWTVLPLDGKEIDMFDREAPFFYYCWGEDLAPKWPSPILVYPSMLY